MHDRLRPLLLLFLLGGCGNPGTQPPDAAASDAALSDATPSDTGLPPLPWDDFEVVSGDVTLHARAHGGRDGSPVMVLLSGGPGFSHDYMTAFAHYASPELRLVFFDQRGTGMSTSPTTSGYAFADYVADLEAVRAAVGADRLHVVGHSWGGGFALAYLGAQPAHVASVVLIDNLPPTDAALQEGQARFLDRVHQLQMAGLIPAPLPRPVDDDCLPFDVALFPAYVADPATVPPAEVVATTSRCTPRNETFAVIAGYDLRPQLVDARAPVAIIFGDSDAFGIEFVTETEAALPMATLTTVIVRDSGHFPWFEQPAQFDDAFRAFMDAQGLELGSE